MKNIDEPIFNRWHSLNSAASRAMTEKRFNDATQTYYLALNEARRILGRYWRHPSQAGQALDAWTRSAIDCSRSHQVRYQKRAAQQVLIEHAECLVQIHSHAGHGWALRVNAARGVPLLLGQLRAKFDLEAAMLSRVSLAHDSTRQFWQRQLRCYRRDA